MFPSSGTSVVKAVGPHTILVGVGESFKRAEARLNGPAGPGRLSELEQSDLWIQVSGAMLAQQAGQATPMMKDVRGIAVGLTLSASPVVSVVLDAADDAAAAGSLLGIVSAP